MYKIGGVSKARNVGLDVATGKYVMFIDADDFYEKDSCKILYKEISSRDADYVIGNYIHVNANGEKWEKPLFDKEIYDNFKLSIKDYRKSFFVMNSVVWNKIFKKELIDKYKLRFIEGAVAEDAIFSIFCYVHTENAYFINDIVYNYRQRKKNSSVSTNCSKVYFEKINEAYKILYEIFKEAKEIGFFRYFYARIAPYLLCKIIDTDYLKEDEEKVETLKMFRWFFSLKEAYDITILNEVLNTIVDNMIDEKYEEALNNMAMMKELRSKLDNVEKEKMYTPTEELYSRMSEYDYKYI